MLENVDIEMAGVRCCEDGPRLSKRPIDPKYDREGLNGRWTIGACCQGGHDGAEIDLFDAIAWLYKNKPEILNQALEEAKK